MPFSSFLINGCLVGVMGQVPLPNSEPVAIPVCNPQSAIHNPQLVPDRYQQTGCPRNVAWWAIPSDTGKYTMYRVGGGCPVPHLAEGPFPCEGTWGWDYIGRLLPHNVILGWWHGLCFQGGVGAYQTDGPNLNHGEATLRLLKDR
jgi:hypothetical protein